MEQQQQQDQLASIVHSPLVAIEQLLAAHSTLAAPSASSSLSESQHAAVKSHFQDLASSSSLLKQIPLLSEETLSSLPDRSLVRFRCFVQDNSLPFEAFPVRCRATHSSTNEQRDLDLIYMDVPRAPWELEYDQAVSQGMFAEKQPHVCVTVPAEAKWVSEADRVRQGHGGLNAMMQNLSIDSQDEQSVRTHPMIAKKLGGSARPGQVVIVKTYGTDDQLQLNEIVEVVGILEKETAADEHDDMEDQEDDMVSPFDTLPRVHAILVETLSQLSRNPLTRAPATLARQYDATAAEHLRSTAIDYLKAHLFGDSLAAEYLFLQLFSRITSRVSEFPVGYFPINLCRLPSNAPQTFAQDLHRAIHDMVPHAHLMPLTLANLNEHIWISPDQGRYANESDLRYDIGLYGGALQLPEHTVLVVDESKMANGVLVDRGVRNLKHLSDAIGNAQLTYGLGFGSTMEKPIDYRIVVVSEGKSMFPAVCVLPLQTHTSEPVSGVSRALEPAVADAIRVFIETGKQGDPVISKEMEQSNLDI
eukprot:jgi/Hompol1/5117/HPOL_004158-RA